MMRLLFSFPTQKYLINLIYLVFTRSHLERRGVEAFKLGFLSRRLFSDIWQPALRRSGDIRILALVNSGGQIDSKVVPCPHTNLWRLIIINFPFLIVPQPFEHLIRFFNSLIFFKLLEYVNS
ncbi:hypothetical protein FGO68_gene5956 [Halteria grandinella]|uniref:Uncharacterized protein n=1 Tax=Halteria grandinella TaxID=5974 RepID=A0A8J8NRT8_HALGN|nr:hypothetical protein FGO68_gene5956 [Halteria grandinella]